MTLETIWYALVGVYLFWLTAIATIGTALLIGGLSALFRRLK